MLHMFTWTTQAAILVCAYMDNFRRPQKPKRRGTLDGVIRRTRTPDTQRIGDSLSSRPEGFSSRQGQPIGNAGGRSTIGQPLASVPETEAVAAAEPDGKPPKKTKRPRSWRTVTKRAGLAVMALVLIGGSYIGVKAFLNARKVLQGGGEAAALQANADPSLLKGEGDGRINILLLGRGGGDHEGPDLTDTMLIASIDPIHKEAALVSIPRDLWVKPPGSGGYAKINSVYANTKYQGDQKAQEAVEQTVEQVFGIPIHYHGMIDFEGFRKAIDTVGGVNVDVKEQLYDPSVAWENNWDPLIAAPGSQHFDGSKALLYVRSRHGSAGGDFSRGERQREVVVALKDKILSAGTYSNPLKVSQLLDAFGGHIQTNFSQQELLRLYAIAKDISSDKVSSIGLTDPPHDYFTTDMIGGQSVVLPKAGIGNYAELQNYIRNTLRDAYLREENASLTVLNGTETDGLAGTTAAELKSYGYNVGTVGDAPTKNYGRTVLVDLRGGAKKYTKHYLEKRLNTTAVTSLPAGIDAGSADFVIIVGRDADQTTQN